jgi:hypothetical protein
VNRARITSIGVGSLLLVCALFSARALAADEKKPVEEGEKKGLSYTATLLPPAGSTRVTPVVINITLDRFTTPEEKARLREILQKEGQHAALDAALKTPIGRLMRHSERSVKILYAAKEATDDGERIVLVAQRFQIYPGVVMNTDTMKLPFSVLWFVPTPDGKGTGKIFGATALELNDSGSVNIQAYKASTADIAHAKTR